MLIFCIETCQTCDFPEGSRPPIPPLDRHIGRCLLLNFTLGRLAPSFKWTELVLGRVELLPFISYYQRQEHKDPKRLEYPTSSSLTTY